MVSRVERSAFADWWWTIDHWLLAALIALMVLGLVLTMAGSPPVAERLGLSTFHFVNRQVLAMGIASFLFIGVSFLSPRQVRRFALMLFIVSMVFIGLALEFGHEIKGARRWIFGIQPSEFIKPAFVILAAWVFSESVRRQDVPARLMGMLLLPLTIIPLIAQPDFGQTMLISLVWGGLFFIAGLHLFWVASLGTIGALSTILAYHFVPHVRARISKFIEPNLGTLTPGDTFQIDTAMDSFMSGGWLGKGPGEGTFKQHLPDSHTDFIFSVTGEEFGIIFCIFIVSLFCFIVIRGLLAALKNEDYFCRFAACGLVMLFGLQSVINMAVNLRLMPAKGMTLPFVSYGGSSLLSMGLTMGFLLALTRKRPRAETSSENGV